MGLKFNPHTGEWEVVADKPVDRIALVGTYLKSIIHNPKRKYKLTRKEYVSIILLLIFEVVASFGGTISYLTFYNGWWPFFTVLLMIACQAPCLHMFITIFDENVIYVTRNFKIIVMSIICPFLIAMLLNVLISFLFFSMTFRNWLGCHLNEYINNDTPTEITFLLCCFYAICLCVSLISTKNKFILYLDKRIFFKSAIIVLIGYLLLFFYPNICEAINVYHIEQERKQIENEYQSQLRINNELQQKRSNQIIDFTFKGIKIGASYPFEVKKAKTIPDLTNVESRYYSISLDGECNPSDLPTIIETHRIMPDTIVKHNIFTIVGEKFIGHTSLDNHPIGLEIYEYNEKVSMIMVMYHLNEENLNQIINLYSDKYGEPERMTLEGIPYRYNVIESNQQYSNLYKIDNKNDYVWSFKNGTIRLSAERIIYLSKEFENTLIRENNTIRSRLLQRLRSLTDSLNILREHREAIERKRAYEDSIKKLNNHVNAINEI
ncbi:MAG: hypothetical protein K1W01_07425 [Muribaculaceae bacterium]